MVRKTCLAAAVAVALTSSTANAQTDFPNRRIHVVVPYPAGGIVDIATRIVTDKLSAYWRQPIIVEALEERRQAQAFRDVLCRQVLMRHSSAMYSWTS